MHVVITQAVLAVTLAGPSTALCSPTSPEICTLLSLFRSAITGVVLTRVMTLRQSPGVWGHGPGDPWAQGWLPGLCESSVCRACGCAQPLECTCHVPTLTPCQQACSLLRNRSGPPLSTLFLCSSHSAFFGGPRLGSLQLAPVNGWETARHNG